jgi:hypothetical protein
MNRRMLEDIKIKKERIFVEPEKTTFPVKKIEEIKKEKVFSEPFTKRLYSNPQPPKKTIKLRKIVFILFVFSIFIGLIFWSSKLFEEVNVTITKKHQVYNLDKEVYTASKTDGSMIPFEVMILSGDKSEKVNLTQSSTVSIKAKGEITLYNEYNKETEKLVANTYLSDENGIVYLTDKPVSIPGYKEIDGVIIPGQVIVGATSFLPGESYNGNPAMFTINAYKNTPKFKKIYGKASTPFTGGASGLMYSMEEKDKDILLGKADASLEDNLLNKVDSLIPNDYIFYPNAYNFSSKIDDGVLSKTAEADINVSGVLSVVLLKEDDLVNAIIKKKLPKISKEEMDKIEINGIDQLIFNFTNIDQLVTKDLDSISFSLKGDLDFIWNPDTALLKSKLKGISKENILEIFKQDIGIEDAKLKIFPPWVKTLPLDEEKIKIQII